MSDPPLRGPIDGATWARLVDMTGGELEFVDELVDTYLRDGADQVAALRASAAAGDDIALGRAAHSLKSGSLTVGALEVGKRARALEDAARGGAVPDAVERVSEVAAAFDAASRALLEAREGRASA